MTKVKRHQCREITGKTGEAVNVTAKVGGCKQACRYRLKLVPCESEAKGLPVNGRS